MIDKIEIKSNFLETYLSEFEQIHFLGNKEESSLYIRVDNLKDYKELELSFWVEFLQTDYAPVIVLYLRLIKGNEEFLFDFIYDIKEENDLLELDDIVKTLELSINVMEFDEELLYFGYSYKLNLNKEFTEELKRIIFKAQELARTMIDNYDINFAIDEFLDGNSIFKSKTNMVNNFELFYPQDDKPKENKNIQTSLDDSALEEEEAAEDKFFTYKSNTSGDFHDEGENLQVKVYKRNDYEKLKSKKDLETKTDDDLLLDKNNSQVSSTELTALKTRIKQLEAIIKSKNKEIERIKTENIHLKEELEYQKLDTPKKGWKLF